MDDVSSVVLMADRSSDADALANELRAEGYSVVTSDIVALPERIERIEPFAIIVDIEQANAEVGVKRVLEHRLAGLLIVAIGGPAAAIELGIAEDSHTRVIARPAAPAPIIAFLNDRLADAADEEEKTSESAPPSESELPPDSVIDRADTGADLPRSSIPEDIPSSIGSAPLASESDAVLSDFPAIAGLPEVEGILPQLEAGPLHVKAAAELSPEIEALLEDSAKRVRELEPDLGGPPVHDADVPVPPDMLALIDDLLAPDESPETKGGSALAAMAGIPDPPATTARLELRPHAAERAGTVAHVTGSQRARHEPARHEPTRGERPGLRQRPRTR